MSGLGKVFRELTVLGLVALTVGGCTETQLEEASGKGTINALTKTCMAHKSLTT